MATKKTKTSKTKKSTKSASAKKKLAAAGTRIMTEAKKIYKASGKKIQWQKCVAKAAKSLKK